MDALLVVNAGSSSLKFQLFAVEGGAPVRRYKGQIDGIGVRPRCARRMPTARARGSHSRLRRCPTCPPPSGRCAKLALRRCQDGRLRAIGHRVVHGGPDFAASVRIDEAVLERLAAYQSLAPLHQPNNLAPIRLVMEIDPTAIPQVACFDTAFHRGHPERRRLLCPAARPA
jgi:acetate kinase